MTTPRIVAIEWGRVETEGGLVFAAGRRAGGLLHSTC